MLDTHGPADDPLRAELSRGDLRRALFRLALPALGEQMLNYCVALFDTFLAGRMSHLGIEVGLSTSAVGIAAYMDWLATLLFSLVGIGTTALVSRAAGRGSSHESQLFTNQSLTLATLLGCLVFALFYFLAPGYALLQGMTGESFRVVVHYLRTEAVGQLFFGVCLIGSAALRGMGDMRTPMVVLGIVNVINICVSSTLVFGWGPISSWGIDGIVTGTIVARIAGGLLMLATLIRGKSGLRIRLDQMLLRRDVVLRILKIGIPAAIDGTLMWVGHSLFLMIIARLGTAAEGKAILAAHMIGVQAEGLTFLPAVAWGAAAATMIGQSLGAGDVVRARRAGHEAARQCGFVTVTGSMAYLFGASAIYHIMTSEPGVWAVGIPALRLLALYQLPLALLVIYMSALRGAGDTRSPMVINTCGILFIRLPLGYLFGIVLNGGLMGAWSAMLVDVAVRALLAVLRYRQGRWVETKV